MRLNIDKEEDHRGAPKLRKCVSRCIVLFGLTATLLLGTFIGFSIYTIPYGHVGYVNGSTDYIGPGLYFQVPWLPKPFIIDVHGGVVVLSNNYTTTSSLLNASSILTKLCRLKYTVEDAKAYIDRITTKYTREEDFKLALETDDTEATTTPPPPPIMTRSKHHSTAGAGGGVFTTKHTREDNTEAPLDIIPTSVFNSTATADVNLTLTT